MDPDRLEEIVGALYEVRAALRPFVEAPHKLSADDWKALDDAGTILTNRAMEPLLQMLCEVRPDSRWLSENRD